MRLLSRLAFAACAALLALAVHAEAPSPAPIAQCQACLGIKFTIEAHQHTLSAIEQEMARGTARMNELVRKGLENPPLPEADRDEAKRLDDQLRALNRAKEATSATLEELRAALDECNKGCAGSASASGESRTGVSVTPGAAAAPSQAKADCPECESAAQKVRALEQAYRESQVAQQAARAELNTLTQQSISGGHTAAIYARIQALRKSLERLDNDVRWGPEWIRKAVGEQEQCNIYKCGGSSLGAQARVFLLMFTGREMGQTESEIEREARAFVKTAQCPECVPAQRAAEAAARAYKEHDERRKDARERYHRLVDERYEGERARDAAQAALGVARTRLTGAALAARVAELEAQIKAAENRIDSRDLDIPRLRRQVEADQKEHLELWRAEWEAWEALGRCNLERCGGDVEVDTVIGVTGTNPFNPDNPTGGPIGTFYPAWGLLRFAVPSYSGGEGGAVLVVVQRTDGTVGPVSVSYATQAGSALAGADFTPASGTLTWADGDATPKSFSIALTDDTVAESPESFTVTLSGPTGGARIADPSTATVNITDNDSPPTQQPAGVLQFSASSFSTAEGAGSVTITVTRTGGTAGAVTVQHFTGPSSATAGSDYTATSGALSWATGDGGVKTFTVPIIDDTAVEGPETFFVTLNNPTGGATLGGFSTSTVTIADNDTAPSGPCGATGHAWQSNTGTYACSGSCVPSPTPQVLTISGDRLTLNPFHAGGAATFTGCANLLSSDQNNLTYFSQSNHSATINRFTNNSFSANITSSGGGTCFFSCSRSGP